MHEAFKTHARFFAVIIVTAVLCACAEGGVDLSPGATRPSSGDRTAESLSRFSPVTLDDARRVAQHRTQYFKQLTVRPKALSFTTNAPQHISVAIPSKTTVYAAADDERIVTVSPQIAATSHAATITLTVTPHRNGRAFVGILDGDLDYAVVAVTVAISGMPTPVPSPTSSVKPSPTPSPVVTVTPVPTATPTGLPTAVPTPTPSASASATPTPVVTVTPVPTRPPTSPP